MKKLIDDILDHVIDQGGKHHFRIDRILTRNHAVLITIMLEEGQPLLLKSGYMVRITLIKLNPISDEDGVPKVYTSADTVDRKLFAPERDLIFSKFKDTFEIFNAVDDSRASTTPPNPSEESAIKEEYQKQYGLTHEQVVGLHRFHSPTIVPRGYTEADIHLILIALKFRLEQKEFGLRSIITTEKWLPNELIQNPFVSKPRSEALQKAIEEILDDIVQYKLADQIMAPN